MHKKNASRFRFLIQNSNVVIYESAESRPNRILFNDESRPFSPVASNWKSASSVQKKICYYSLRGRARSLAMLIDGSP